ncbi:MAG: hypothetical protein IMX01_06935 [Limnochordaceae bacterium]|nr:hypothetical protein [Limnochordaceae bacterium]
MVCSATRSSVRPVFLRCACPSTWLPATLAAGLGGLVTVAAAASPNQRMTPPLSSAAPVLDELTVNVQARVLPFEQLEILEPVEVDFVYPWPGADAGRPLVLPAVGLVQLQSNAPWQLGLWSTLVPGFTVEVRLAGQPGRRWVPVAPALAPMTIGRSGEHQLRWDIRITPRAQARPGRYHLQMTPIASVL